VVSAWNTAATHAAKDRVGTRSKISFIVTLPKRYVEQVRQVPGVKAATWANWFGGKDLRHKDHFFANYAVDPASFLEVYDECVLAPEQKTAWLQDRRGAVLGSTLARKLGVTVGSRITLSGTIHPGNWQFNVSGIYRSSRRSLDQSLFLFHWSYLNDSIPPRFREQVSWIISRVDDAPRAAAVSRAIDAFFDEKEWQTLTMSERAMNLSFLGMISALMQAVSLISVLILVIMTLILGNTIAMSVRERTSELAVLRALGFLPRQITLFILAEATLLGVIGGVLGLGLAYPVVNSGLGPWVEENLGGLFPYFRIEAATTVAALIVSLLVGALAAALPARNASKLVVTDALRHVG
jgi:putative ABC transport system permease protein